MSSAAAVRKTVSVLFCDLADSTALGERLDPETYRAVMAVWYQMMRAPLARHGGRSSGTAERWRSSSATP
jgi:class 3 adenylate cyclase